MESCMHIAPFPGPKEDGGSLPPGPDRRWNARPWRRRITLNSTLWGHA